MTTRKKHTGEPTTNGGHFGSTAKSEPTSLSRKFDVDTDNSLWVRTASDIFDLDDGLDVDSDMDPFMSVEDQRALRADIRVYTDAGGPVTDNMKDAAAEVLDFVGKNRLYLTSEQADRIETLANEHRTLQAAGAKEREARESFERSDTDGFASQHASGLAAERLRLQAAIDVAGGTHEFPALFDTEGNLVPAKRVDTKYGTAWAVLSDPNDPSSEATAWVNESKADKSATRKKNLAKKGYVMGTVRARAAVHTYSSGKGFSGLHSVQHYIGRSDGGFSADAEIVSTDSDDTDY